jgi:RNA polymerase sigma-70 factor (ECF subfamily)
MSAATRARPPAATTGRAPEAPDFDTLYREHFAFVWRSLRRLGVPPALVEDAAQDAFVVAHRRFETLQAGASPRAWVFGIAWRVASDYRRSARRKGPQVELEEGDVAGPHESPYEGAAKAQAVALLERFLQTLDEDQRAVFILAELEQMSAPEIAAALETNLNTVYSRLRTARIRFAEAITELERSAP